MPLSILDLPTELLLPILTDLPSQDVYSLALVCRRLHFTALPVYFSRHGLPSSTRSIQIRVRTDRRDLLAALRVALFDTPLDHIDFIFSHPDPDATTPSVAPLLEQFQRVEGFFSKVTSIQNVSLDLDHGDCFSYSYHLSVGSDEALRAWAKGFGDLLNCVVETRSTSLTVLHGGYFSYAYELSPAVKRASWLGRMISWAKTFTGRQRPAFRRVSQQGVAYVAIALPRQLSRASHLTCIHIHSRALILPPGVSWTLGVLRNCPISQLTFSNFWVPSTIWETVLPLIASAAPGLTSVGFIELNLLPEHNIMDFLARLPGLVDVTISASEESSKLFLPTTPRPRLPHLTHLRTDPFIVCYLLSREGSLPALSSVTMLFSSISRVEHIAKILITIIDMLAAHPRRPAPLLAVATTRSSEPLRSSGGDDVTPEWSAALDHVQRIEVNWVVSSDVVSSDVVEEAIRRITLRVAKFRRANNVAIKLEPDADIGDLPQRLAGSIVRTEFLQTIEVNGREYPLLHGEA
ncbi:hypothetical protein DFH06DRAFT_1481597 [Mycena polygramma]|nr:hypothetical protein DFH06DRAFT_1481597 [Mycena polygramma]